MCDVSVGVWTWFTMLLLSLLLCLSSCRSRAGFVTSASVTRVTTTEDEERNEDTVSVTEALDTGTSDPGPGLAPRLAPDQPRTFTGLVGQRADMEVAFCEDAGKGTASLEWSVAGVTLHPGTWYTPSVEGGMKVVLCLFDCGRRYGSLSASAIRRDPRRPGCRTASLHYTPDHYLRDQIKVVIRNNHGELTTFLTLDISPPITPPILVRV